MENDQGLKRRYAVWRHEHDEREDAHVYEATSPRAAALEHAAHVHMQSGFEWSWPVTFHVADDLAVEGALERGEPVEWWAFSVERETVPEFWTGNGEVVRGGA